MPDVKVTLDRAQWRHPGALAILRRKDPYVALPLYDPESALYSLPGLLLKSAGVSDALLSSLFSPDGLANSAFRVHLPSHLQWMLYCPRPTELCENSEVERVLHQWSDEGILTGATWQRLDVVEETIVGTLRALGIDAQWVGRREDATQRASRAS